jgi:ATP-binding cassette subfamily F protein uup
MLQPADILLLDEPTNDLDIPTLEILEETLVEFPGSLVLVTHDRYMLDRVSTIVLGLDGNGGAQSFADYTQWEAWQAGHVPSRITVGAPRGPASARTGTPAKKKLSYLESREYGGIEQRIAEAEQVLRSRHAELGDPAIAMDAARLLSAQAALEAAQKDLDVLYTRWAELEEKNG